MGERRALAKLSTIMDNTSHPLHQTVGALSSSFSNRLRTPKVELISIAECVRTESTVVCSSLIPKQQHSSYLRGHFCSYHGLLIYCRSSFLHYNYISRCNLIFQVHFMSYQKDFSQFICPSNCFSSFIGSFIALCDS
ncbi:hypothetical protein L3Q82_007493 [Scortum barcoo]|uniref:Uncharacterized protein n=1 Tax=Scortum barcoo TaxID=214431 RepID=A0ACB8WP55_9TELE|nr:hypothetical protein L3Q82_007493 [Scortum barcoo]